ncbi:hypothetical protein FPV67DRAFT_1445541 [Lyophyllum atratum]|nr:hypothetical protein FPV67DRAFT_1445541 [Lyophyllum atratum]
MLTSSSTRNAEIIHHRVIDTAIGLFKLHHPCLQQDTGSGLSSNPGGGGRLARKLREEPRRPNLVLLGIGHPLPTSDPLPNFVPSSVDGCGSDLVVVDELQPLYVVGTFCVLIVLPGFDAAHREQPLEGPTPVVRAAVPLLTDTSRGFSREEKVFLSRGIPEKGNTLASVRSSRATTTLDLGLSSFGSTHSEPVSPAQVPQRWTLWETTDNLAGASRQPKPLIGSRAKPTSSEAIQRSRSISPDKTLQVPVTHTDNPTSAGSRPEKLQVTFTGLPLSYRGRTSSPTSNPRPPTVEQKLSVSHSKRQRSSAPTISSPLTTSTKPQDYMMVEEGNSMEMRAGMERGYEMSPMAAIRLELEKEEEDEISIYTAAGMMAGRTALGKSDIVDRGVAMPPSSTPRFVLNKELLYELSFVTEKLQEALKQASELCEERTGYFKIDPRGVLFRVLKGTNDIGLINVAWVGLRRRIELALKTMEKYEAQYQNRLAIISSPTSTATELYEPLDRLESSSDQMRELFDRVPHFRDQLSESSQGKTKTFRSWSKLVPVPEEIIEAFPDRKPEKHPAIRYYDDKGRFIEIDYSLNREDDMERERTTRTEVQSGKQREVPPHLPAETWRGEESQSYPLPVDKRPDAEALLGSGTPFKGSSGMFDNIPFPPSMDIPSREGLPNVLHGLATPSGSLNNPFYSNPSSDGIGTGGIDSPDWRDRSSATVMTAHPATPGPAKPSYGTPWSHSPRRPLPATTGTAPGAMTSSTAGPSTSATGNVSKDLPGGNNGREGNGDSGSSGGGRLPYNQFPRQHHQDNNRGPPNPGDPPGGGGGPPNSGAENLEGYLRKFGLTERPRQFSSQRRANTTEAEKLEDFENLNGGVAEIPESSNQPMDGDRVLKECFAILQRRQRAPPVGGYPFQKNDHVTTKMGRLPPSPCKCCGSKNHWDKECPDWAVYLERAKRRANVTMTLRPEEESAYQSAYSVLLEQRLVDSPQQAEDFRSAAESLLKASHRELEEETRCKSADSSYTVGGSEDSKFGSSGIPLDPVKDIGNGLSEYKDNCNRKPSSELEGKFSKRRASFEEVRDEHWAAMAEKPKAKKHLIEELDDPSGNYEEEECQKEGPEAVETQSEGPHPESRQWANEDPTLETDFQEGEWKEAFTANLTQSETQSSGSESSDSLPPPKIDNVPVKLTKWRKHKPGSSAMGISVLAMKGWVGSTYNTRTDLRLDSCADITLISREFYDSLKSKPRLQQGKRMNLWQLTDKEASISGFVSIPVSIEEGAKVQFGRTHHTVQAEGVGRTKDFERLRQSVALANKFTKSKTHKREQARRRRRKTKLGEDARTIRAADDYKLKPHECHNILVEGNFKEEREWLVEKNLLSNHNGSMLAVPNVLISSRRPIIPISNPSDSPRYIRKGEVIGTITDPQEFFDNEQSSPGGSDLRKKAEAMAAIIRVSMNDPTDKADKDEESETEESTHPHGWRN